MTFTPSKKQRLQKSTLYLILDTSVNSPKELFSIARTAFRLNVDLIQLRDKAHSQKDILEFADRLRPYRNGHSLFVINDHVDLALAAGADAVHLGQNDLPLEAAREVAGERLIIGQSCQTIPHLKRSVQDGADYIGFGSVFPTQTKPGRKAMAEGLIEEACRTASLPLFAIGGIDRSRIPALQRKGIRRFAVCRDICLAPDVAKAIQETQALLKDGPPA